MFSFIGNAQTTRTEPEYGSDVKISNSVVGKTAEIGFLIDIGRASKHCRRFGFCDVVLFWIVIYKGAPANANQIVLDIKGESGNQYLLIELNDRLDPNKFDTNFYVDNNLTSKNNEATIIKGIYKLDSLIGKYGGYKFL